MSRIKEIWCMPHSHLDIGYTHPQPMLLELQVDYLRQALALCEATKEYPEGTRFCWTVEANAVLRKWLETASREELDGLRAAICRGQVCVTALPFHTTPCADANEMVSMLEGLDELRQTLGAEIRVAINHDVNGQPWTLGQLLLDSGVDFYLTGINIHFGGIPFPRPAAFLWEMADGRRLPTWLGEHYSLFSQYLYTEEHSTQRMLEGAEAYADWLEKQGYAKDFAFLTATNPPLYDNNCPDAELPDLIRRYNEEGHPIRLRLVTAEDLRNRVLADRHAGMPVHRGDWTDYWNFGCGSTARETRVSRLGKQMLEKADTVSCFTGKPDAHSAQVRRRCYESALVFDEHTWGASQSVTEPDSPETYAQWVHKVQKAYETADLGAYLLGSAMERLSGNPHQSNALGGVSLVNTSPFPQKFELLVPESYLRPVRQLASLRIKGCDAYLEQAESCRSFGLLELPPFTAKTVPFSELERLPQEPGAYRLDGGTLETPFYRVRFDPETGAVTGLFDWKRGRALLSEQGYALFEPVRETVDAAWNPPTRETLFPRNVDLGNHSITQWNHDWKSLRVPAVRTRTAEILRGPRSVTLVSHPELPGMEQAEQRVTFYTWQPKIRMEIRFRKTAVYEPEAVYFAVPLKMEAGWECSYDTAGQFVRLDRDQLGTVCRDWVTVDTCVSVYASDCCATLSCPDAPLVQVGGFHFGKESREIPRQDDPLLLGWGLNNYWNTNFCADQSGRMTLAYELTWHDCFSPETALADGISAQNPCLIGASVSGQESTRTLLRAGGGCVIRNVFPDEGGGLRILAVNPRQEEGTLILERDGAPLTGARVIAPSGRTLAEIPAENGTVHLKMPGGRICLLRLPD